MLPTAWPLPPRTEDGTSTSVPSQTQRELAERIDWGNLSQEDKEVLFSWLDEFFAAYFSRMALSKDNQAKQEKIKHIPAPLTIIPEVIGRVTGTPPASPSESITMTESDTASLSPPLERRVPPALPSAPRLTQIPPRAPRAPRAPRQSIVKVPPSALRTINRAPSLPTPSSAIPMHTRSQSVSDVEQPTLTSINGMMSSTRPASTIVTPKTPYRPPPPKPPPAAPKVKSSARPVGAAPVPSNKRVVPRF